MFNVNLKCCRSRKHESEARIDVAIRVANDYLRERVTMPARCNDDASAFGVVASGERLAPVSRAFRDCCSEGGNALEPKAWGEDTEHPWDQELRRHVLSTHGNVIRDLAETLLQRTI